MELFRFRRQVKDFFELVDRIETQGANLKSLKEPWANTTTHQGQQLFIFSQELGNLKENLISQRTKEGLASARARGSKGGQPKLPADKIKLTLKMYRSKDYSIAEITEATGVSKKVYIDIQNNKSKKRFLQKKIIQE